MRKFNNSKIFLPVHGQVTYLFTTPLGSEIPAKFKFTNKKSGKIKIEISNQSFNMIIQPEKTKPPIQINSKTGLIPAKNAFYWVSLDSQHQAIKFGIGEARPETVKFAYNLLMDSTNLEQIDDLLSQNDKVITNEQHESYKKFFESLSIINNISNIKPLKLLRDPIINPVPLKIKRIDELTMSDVAEYKYLPNAFLTQTNQQLFNCISGKNFVLDDDYFPDFSKAIQHSIVTEGCWCYKKLQEKSTEFNPDKPNLYETYLRITLGRNSGESPGIPYVMEIWPSNHYSPIHSHADSNAVIRVLHGSINVTLFPFLGAIDPFGNADFEKDDITWLSPELNQIHQLRNITSEVCITIQCYMYDSNNTKHYDYFDYIDDNKNIVQYEPDSDMNFINFKDIIKNEWNNKKEEVTIYS
jgi:hypothetical protein